MMFRQFFYLTKLGTSSKILNRTILLLVKLSDIIHVLSDDKSLALFHMPRLEIRYLLACGVAAFMYFETYFAHSERHVVIWYDSTCALALLLIMSECEETV